MTPLAQVTELLSQLVACPSVNPKSAAKFSPPLGEAGMVALLEKLLRSWGASIQIHEVHPNRPNLLATFPGKNPGRSILLDAHTDTVAVDGMIIAPFTPTVRDGRLYGRGACDTKGPMAAMLLALRRILDEAGQPPVTIYFAATCNEESGGTGAAALAKQNLRVDFALAAEPTDLKIVHMHKGALRVDIKTSGVAAHSSTPDRGVNAIYKMCRVVARLEREVAPALAKQKHPQLGSPTLSVGLINGGSQVNIVPEICSIQVDRRVIPGENQDEIVRQLAGDEHYEITEFYTALDEPADSPASKHVAAACRRVLGQAEFVVAPYATNAGIYHAAGIPALVLGPGSLAQAHTKDEFIELNEVVRGVDLFAEIIRSL
ncbi:MAG: Acetylornithine deacetylase [Verrucomicrobiae bacterium]|nr:Acetylornithine deacetylase [Verrucomicrobiae bacterium]